MRWLTADLHIHSVLSPCGGLEMSPRELVARAKECGIDWIAITDHNTVANCQAYETAAKAQGVFFSWGVEVQTAEEIHLLVYFDNSGQAQEFGRRLYHSLLPLENDPAFFGDQVIIDENENILGMEQKALMNSSVWDLNTAVERARKHGGYCVPAHIDAEANSILGQLGFIPAEPDFDLLGITANLDLDAWLQGHADLSGRAFLRASDAHYLNDVGSGVSRILVSAPTAAELASAAQGTGTRKIIV